MTFEQDKTIEALRISIQMEIDGKAFYIKSSEDSRNEPGKKLFARLAEEEDIHRRIFLSIFDSMSNKKGWPQTHFQPDKEQGLRTLFIEAIEQTRTNLQTIDTELDAVIRARQMETNTYDYYTARSGETSVAAEKEFYHLLAMQEQGHNLILADYFEYLNNPAGFFVNKEHPHLD
jgi:rubrerythrin